MIELTDLQVKLADQLLLTILNNEPTITYGELAKRVDPPIHHRNVGKNVGQISMLCYELGLPLLSAKVIGKETTTSGKGFYDIYTMLGIPTEGKTHQELYDAQRKAIQECKEWYRLEDYLGLNIGMPRPYPKDPLITVVIIPQKEGKKKEIYTTKYERNPKNRENAIKRHGTRCMVCGFDFEAFYGEAGRGIIDVHHVKPLSDIGEEITIDPEKDLMCVCSNCHRIIHKKKNGVFTLDEVREMIATAKIAEKRLEE